MREKGWLICMAILCLGCGACVQTTQHHKHPSNMRAVYSSQRLLRQSKWPKLPSSSQQVQQLLKRFPIKASAPNALGHPTATEVSDRIFKSSPMKLIAGWPAIISALQQTFATKKTSYLLWGTAHDSKRQLTRFARMIGGTGLTGITDVVLELFYADGHWTGIPKAKQLGDNDLLKAIARRGARKDLQRLHSRQRRWNYAAWKHHYLDEIVDITLLARAQGIRVHSCDMPLHLRRRLPFRGRLLHRMREYHCALANNLQKDDGRKVMMFWGRGHIVANGLPRFLPPKAKVTAVFVYGGGARPSGLEQGLSDELALMDPLLVPIKSTPTMKRYVLLIPDYLASKRWMKTRTQTQKKTAYNLAIEGAFREVKIGKKSIKVSTKLRLPPGDYTTIASLKNASHTLIGNIKVMKRGYTRLSFRQKLRVEYHQWNGE